MPAELRALFRTRNGAMREVVKTASRVLDHDASILILGESGVGKDYLAQAIHACGIRRAEPFIHLECASVPAELFESELFGHERGTFTDAQTRKPGRLELARGGTLYLDEISALAPQLQAKLLRVIEERRFSRLGGSALLPFEARVLSSSNADVTALLAADRLRRDFYYRINDVTIQLPSLRSRPEDILPLAQRFLKRAGKRFRGFDADAERLLVSYDWPGNIRELRNAVERAALMEEGGAITAGSLPIANASGLIAAANHAAWTLEELEKNYIRDVLQRTQSNYSRAAVILGINRKTLLEKRRKYGLG